MCMGSHVKTTCSQLIYQLATHIRAWESESGVGSWESGVSGFSWESESGVGKLKTGSRSRESVKLGSRSRESGVKKLKTGSRSRESESEIS